MKHPRHHVPAAAFAALAALACGDEQVTLPAPDPNAVPAVERPLAADVGNAGNGSDLWVRFTRLEDESEVAEYRILVARATSTLEIDASIGIRIAEPFYVTVSTGEGTAEGTLGPDATDVGGVAIKSNIRYEVLVLTVPTEESGRNPALSLPSAEVTLTFSP